MTLNRTSLTAYAASMREPDPDGPRHLAKRKWHEDGTIIFLAEDVARMDFQDRELLRAVAARHYGPRATKGSTR